MSRSSFSNAEFVRLAHQILSFQAAHIPAVNRLFDPDRVEADVGHAALPTDVFRLRRIAAHPPEADVRVFRTSGTTEGRARRGEHCFRTLRTYETGALIAARRRLLREPVPRKIISLAPSEVALPDSSLSFMIDLFARALDIPIVHLFDVNSGIDHEALEVEAAKARLERAPVLIVGTSFAFVHVIDAQRRGDLGFPSASRLMLTGGFKGRSREVSETELREGLVRVFGLSDDDIIGEYGMTELSSQMYESRGLYIAPPWVKIDAVDPETLRPLPEGEVGLCRIVDLANVDSAIAVQTADRVVKEGIGFRLLGRSPGAPPRGCSLLVEDLLAHER